MYKYVYFVIRTSNAKNEIEVIGVSLFQILNKITNIKFRFDHIRF